MGLQKPPVVSSGLFPVKITYLFPQTFMPKIAENYLGVLLD